MADDATNTSYPHAVERLPEINSSSRMLDPDVRHDVMHDKIHATLNALQDLVGTAAETTEATVLDRMAALESASPPGHTAFVLPMVNGEIPPRLMHDSLGNLIYSQVT